MNEVERSERRDETRPSSTRQNQRRMPWGRATQGRIRATSAFAVHPPFPAPRRLATSSSPAPRVLLTRSQLGAPDLPSQEGTSSRAGISGPGWLPQPPRLKPLESLLGGLALSCTSAPQASRSPGRSRRRCSAGRARAAEEGSVRAEGRVSPARPAARRSVFTAAPRPISRPPPARS